MGQGQILCFLSEYTNIGGGDAVVPFPALKMSFLMLCERRSSLPIERRGGFCIFTIRGSAGSTRLFLCIPEMNASKKVNIQNRAERCLCARRTVPMNSNFAGVMEYSFTVFVPAFVYSERQNHGGDESALVEYFYAVPLVFQDISYTIL